MEMEPIEQIKLKLLSVFKTYAKECLKIKTKKGVILPFIFNKPQERVDTIFETQLKKNKPLRFIVLKARQEGISTYFEGRIFDRNTNYPNRKAIIIGHVGDASDNLFEMFNTYYDNLPAEMKPTTQYSNKKEIYYGEINSSIEVMSAENRDSVGRSGTIQDLHATEVAFWPDAEKTMLALLQTIPDEPNTLSVIESTANGIGGWFYNFWKSAEAGENDYTPIFLAWFDLEDYQRPFETKEKRDVFASSLDEYEKMLVKNFGLTLEQLNWRRYTIKNKCGDSVDQFKQEYPSTPEEAFVASGKPVFNQNICYQNYQNAKEPKKIGNLEYVYKNNAKEITGVKFVENAKGFIKLHYPIDVKDSEELRYAGGCDVAEGLEQGDRSIVKVKDRRLGKIALTWAGHIDPDLLGEELHKIQLYLKDKWYVNVEANNHGLTTITTAYKLGVSQFYRQDFKAGRGAETKDFLGTKTTGGAEGTRVYMLNLLKESIRNNKHRDDEREFWSEALTFVRNSKGKEQAQNKDKDPGTKCYDDRILATALMEMCDRWMPNYFEVNKISFPKWYYEEMADVDEDNTPRKSTVMAI